MEGAAVATEGVDIDVQPERAERLGLTAGDSLSVHIPGDKIFTFSREP